VRDSFTAFIIPKYNLIPTTFQRDHFDGDRGGNRSGGFYRRSESRPCGGGGDDDGLVVVVVAATTAAAPAMSYSDVTMIHGETRQ